MSLVLPAESPPLREDTSGTIRVGQTRVTLDTVVEQYRNGMSPEDLVRAYDSLDLADVHAVIAYYLRHQDEVNQYLEKRSASAASVRDRIEAGRPHLSKAELLTRQNLTEAENAPAGQ